MTPDDESPFLETPTDSIGWFNLVCTRIAIVMLAGMALIYLETL